MSEPIQKRNPQAGKDINVRLTAIAGGSALVLVALAAVGLGFLVIPGSGKSRPPRSPRAQAAMSQVKLAEEPVATPLRSTAGTESTQAREEVAPRPREEKQEVAYLTPEASVNPPKPAPKPEPSVVPTPPSAKPAMKRLNSKSAEELRQDLALVSELAIGGKPSRVMVTSGASLTSSIPEQLTRPLLNSREDLAGLPAKMGHECKLEALAAQSMQNLSREIRRAMVTQHPVASLRQTLTGWEFRQDSAVPCLCQMLSAGDAEIRQLLVRQLADIPARSAAEALAKLALYDIDSDIRTQAIQALKDKPGRAYRDVLLAGFRHPWPTVAEHAAEALVALGDRASLKALNELEKLPDPSLPTRDPERGYTVPEMVRVNHLRNCTLCHAPSQETTDLVRGRMPQTGVALPPPSVYYEDNSPGIFVRADMTYLRQDFSVMQSVSNSQPWPEWQHYDYLVRQRPVNSREASKLLWTPNSTPPDTYPQREAVRFAIKELMAWYSF